MEKIKNFFKKLWSKIAFWRNDEADQEEMEFDNSLFVIRAITVILIVGLLVGIVIWFFLEPITREIINTEGKTQQVVVFSWLKAWAWVVAFYIVASYRFWDPVPIGKQAALTFFQRPIANLEAGAPFAPPFVTSVEIVSAKVEQREFPAEPENIYRGEMKSEDALPAGKRPPIRIQFRDSITKQEAKKLFGDDFTAIGLGGEEIPFVAHVPEDGLGKRVTAEVQHVVRIRIDNPSQFISNIGDLDEAFKQIEDEMVAVLTRYYTRMSLGQALMNVRWMSIHLYRAVERRVGGRADIKSWGVDPQAAFVKIINTSHGINIAIAKAAQAPFERSTTEIAAAGEKTKRQLEGEGAAHAAHELEKQTLSGRAAGIKSLAVEISVSGSEAQAAEVARIFGQNGNTVIVGTEGFGQLAGIAAATIGKNQGSKSKTEPSTVDGSVNQTSDKGEDS